MKINDIVEGKVLGIYPTHVLVKLKNDQVAILHISEVSDYFVYGLKKMFDLNRNYYFEIIGIDLKEKRVNLSWKNLVPRFLKNPFEFDLKPTENGFKNLQKFVEEKVRMQEGNVKSHKKAA